jgi:hypothetical protein
MAFDEKLAGRIRDVLEGEPFVEKKMFGGVAFIVSFHVLRHTFATNLVRAVPTLSR